MGGLALRQVTGPQRIVTYVRIRLDVLYVRYYGLFMLNNINAVINLKSEILDTYEGMASLYDGEGEYPAHIFNRIDDLKVEIAALEAQYNSLLAVIEGDA